MGEGYKVSEAVQKVYGQLSTDAAVKAGIEFLAADHTDTIAEQIAINQVEAPPFQESERAGFYMAKLQESGLSDVRQDAEGNVYGVFRGNGNGPRLFVSAHLEPASRAPGRFRPDC